jgi:hypothetical protein
MSLCADLSKLTLGETHPDTVTVSYLKRQWAAEDVPECSVEAWGGAGVGIVAGGTERSVEMVDSVGDGGQDATGGGSTWNQLQFLWLL